MIRMQTIVTFASTPTAAGRFTYGFVKSIGLALAGIAVLAIAPTGCASESMLVSANTNECMNVPWHGYPVDGTPIRLLYCRGHRNQYWTLGNGQITGIGGSCLDVQGSQPVDGSPVIYVACNGSPSQHWTLQGTQVVGIGGKCLDVTQSNIADSTPLIIATCSGSPSQQWQVR
jgi:Ricin-type beta-trefoil lectin domain